MQTDSHDQHSATQAIPPVRVREVCESLNYEDENGTEHGPCELRNNVAESSDDLEFPTDHHGDGHATCGTKADDGSTGPYFRTAGRAVFASGKRTAIW